jgi:hypothetical protein
LECVTALEVVVVVVVVAAVLVLAGFLSCQKTMVIGHQYVPT